MNEHRRLNTRTVPLYRWGLTRHPSGDFVVDDVFYNALQEFQHDMARRGYYTPFACNHASHGPEHERLPTSALTYGRLTGLVKTEEGIDGEVYFAEGVAAAYDAGLLDSISPSHYTHGFVDPHTGKRYVTGLREVSAVRVRHQKNLPGASTWYHMDEAPQWRSITALEEEMTTPNTAPAQGAAPGAAPVQAPGAAAGAPQQPGAQGAAPTPGQAGQQATAGLEQRFELLSKSYESLQAEQAKSAELLAKLLAKFEPPTATNGEAETPEQKRLRELESLVASQDHKLKLADARVAMQARLPNASVAQITSLAEASLVMKADQLEAIVKPLEEAAKAQGQQAGTTILSEIGAQGGPSGKVTVAQAQAAAQAAGIPVGKDRALWIRQHYPGLNY